MILEEYSLKFTLLCKDAPSLVSNPRDELSKFLIGIFELVREECRTKILNDNMNLSRLIMYYKSIEDS